VQAGDPVEPVASILAEITTPVRLAADPQVTHKPHASAGITIFDGVDGTWTTVLRRADLACYHAKARTSAFEVYNPGMTRNAPASWMCGTRRSRTAHPRPFFVSESGRSPPRPAPARRDADIRGRGRAATRSTRLVSQ
jgi:hypothetical protein